MTERIGVVMARAGPTLLGLAVLACAHEVPFRPDSYGSDTPFVPGSPTRLTLNQAPDRTPAWTPDGAGLWYSFARTDRPDGDHCLGRLPPDGGSRVEARCHTGLAAEDSTDVLESPSVALDGRLAYVHVTGAIGARTPVGGEILVSPPGGGPGVRALRLPNGPPGQPGFDRAAHIQWLGDDTLVFVGELRLFVENRVAGITDTIESGVGIDVVQLGDTVPTRLPGTDWASSVALGDGGRVLYYTLNADSRVFRREIATGATATVYDFGALGIARGVQVGAGRLVAVVGGDVVAAFNPNLGALIQADEGGYLYWVDLASGTATQLPDTSFRYRRPALSSDGRRVVAEVQRPGGPDLWMIELP